MSLSRRTVLSGTGAILAAAVVPQTAVRADDAAALIEQSARANAALMRGDLATYRSLVDFTDDFTLMSPFGGAPTHAAQLSEEAMQRLGRFFRNGSFAQEVVQTYASPDMVTLAVIERANVEVGGLPAQDWALRVTLVYRRVGSEWLLAHRHADPLVHGITHEAAAVLARGD